MHNYIEKQRVTKEKEKADSMLLQAEVYIGVLAVIIFLTGIMMASMLTIDKALRILVIVASTTMLVICACFNLKIEQLAGYYECRKCKHRYIPEYKSVFWAMHIGRTRYMKCPECKEKSWQKKVLTKDKQR